MSGAGLSLRLGTAIALEDAAFLRFPVPVQALALGALVFGAYAIVRKVSVTERELGVYSNPEWWAGGHARPVPFSFAGWVLAKGPCGPIEVWDTVGAVGCPGANQFLNTGTGLVPGSYTNSGVLVGLKFGPIVGGGFQAYNQTIGFLRAPGVTGPLMVPGLKKTLDLPAVWYPSPAIAAPDNRYRPPWAIPYPLPLQPWKSGIRGGFPLTTVVPRPGVRKPSIPHSFVEGGRRVAVERPARAASGAQEVPVVLFPGVLAPGADLVGPFPAPGTIARPGTGDGTFAVQVSRQGVRSVPRNGLSRPSGKEVKFAFRAASRFAEVVKYNLTTEFRDFIEGLWDNIPDSCKQFRSKTRLQGKNWRRRRDLTQPTRIVGRLTKAGRPMLARMTRDVWDHWDCIQWAPWTETVGRGHQLRVVHHRGALEDLALNEVEDRFYGGLGHAAKKASRRLGFTAGVQFGGGLMNRRASAALGVQSPVDWAADLVGL